MKAPLLHDMTVWSICYVRAQRANEFGNDLATRFDWQRIGVTDWPCESWRCGIAPPLVELAHRLPEGMAVQALPGAHHSLGVYHHNAAVLNENIAAAVQTSGLAMHTGDHALYFARSDTDFKALMTVWASPGC